MPTNTRHRQGRSDAAAIPAKLLIDPSAIAGLQGGADMAPLLKQVAELLIEIRNRLDGESAPVLDVAGVEKLTGLSERTLRNHQCPVHKVGGAKRYLRAEVLEWLASQPIRSGALVEAAG